MEWTNFFEIIQDGTCLGATYNIDDKGTGLSTRCVRDNFKNNRTKS